MLFAPGVKEAAQIQHIVQAVQPKPVNVLISSNLGLTVADLADLGVRRISLGSALARAAWAGFLQAANRLAKEGSFEGLTWATPFAELNSMF